MNGNRPEATRVDANNVEIDIVGLGEHLGDDFLRCGDDRKVCLKAVIMPVKLARELRKRFAYGVAVNNVEEIANLINVSISTDVQRSAFFAPL